MHRYKKVQSILIQSRITIHSADFHVVGMLLLALMLPAGHLFAATQEPADGGIRPLLTKYCGECHQGDDLEGDFGLAELDGTGDSLDENQLQRWEQVGEALLDDYMPPEDSPQPTEAEKAEIVAWIKSHAMPESEIAVVRRMNRVEYENTVRDLFRLTRFGFANPSAVLKLDDYFDPSTKKMPRYVFAVSHFAYPDMQRPELLEVTSPPIDLAAEHGFNNDVESLQFSPLIAEKFIQLSRDIVNSPTLSVISDLWKPLFIYDPKTNGDSVEDVKPVARARLAEFLPRAFRRPVEKSEVERYVDIFIENYVAIETPPENRDQLPRTDADSGRFTEAMKSTVSTVLIAPDFLFLFQPPTDESLSTEQRQSIFNASRLSYFLWASMPDDELLAEAFAGKLCTDQQLRSTAKRMMLDKKVKSLATDFGMQWLKVNRLTSSQPDPDKFPKFYSRKKQPISIAMMIEQLLLFETVLVEDRSLNDFIHADFAYINRDLMYWYGYSPKEYIGYMPPNAGPTDFFRINFPDTHLRGGVITSGATAVLTSTSFRTSPVFRGAWVSETIFNRPPPPPPADVPALEVVPARLDGQEVTLRDRLEIHRKDPNCASCHSKIDPLGFALEQLDAVGRIRHKYENGEPVDAKGEFEGQVFTHAYSLKQMILRKQEVFVRAFVEHMLRYAINREPTLADQDEIDRIAAAVIADGGRFHSVVDHIVGSPTFRAKPNR